MQVDDDDVVTGENDFQMSYVAVDQRFVSMCHLVPLDCPKSKA